MKHKVAELEGALLDAAIGKAEFKAVKPGSLYLVAEGWVYEGPAFSQDGWHGVRIIERERIQLVPPPHGTDLGWTGIIIEMDADRPTFMGAGPTALVAAMRCFVFSKFGDEVDL